MPPSFQIRSEPLLPAARRFFFSLSPSFVKIAWGAVSSIATEDRRYPGLCCHSTRLRPGLSPFDDVLIPSPGFSRAGKSFAHSGQFVLPRQLFFGSKHLDLMPAGLAGTVMLSLIQRPNFTRRVNRDD